MKPTIALLVFAGVAGCTEPNPYAVDGYWWCTSADLACGTNQNNQIECVTRPDGQPVRACLVLCPADHTIMVDGENDQLLMGTDEFDRWQEIRNALSTAAESSCNNVAASKGITINPANPLHTTCDEALADERPSLRETDVKPKSECEADDESGGAGDDGPGGAGGPGIYGLSSWSEVRQCPNPTSCNVDVDFIDDVMDEVSIPWNDNMLLQKTTGGYVFNVCGQNSLAYALGFRVGDKLTAVQGMPLTNLTQYYAIRHALTDWSIPATVTYKRGTQTRQLTVFPVNMGSYP